MSWMTRNVGLTVVSGNYADDYTQVGAPLGQGRVVVTEDGTIGL